MMGSPFYWPMPPPKDYVSLDDPLEYLRRAAAEDVAVASSPVPPPAQITTPGGVPDDWDLSLPFGLEKKLPTLQDLATILFEHKDDAGTKTPAGTAGAGSGGETAPLTRPAVAQNAPPTEPPSVGDAWWNNGHDNAFHPDVTDLGEGLSRYSSPGGRTTWDVPAHADVDESGAPIQYGSVTASMAPGWTPGHEDLSGLKRHAVNAADFQVPNPVPPPPVPTTVTSARFDQKEGFVPLGPPTGAGTRESYQGVPTDPEEERQRRMEREAQNLQLEEMRQKVRDPYGKERFAADQHREDLRLQSDLSNMSKKDRTEQYLKETKDLDDYSRRAMDSISRLNIPEAEKKSRIVAAEERMASERQRIREAYGIDARYNRETP